MTRSGRHGWRTEANRDRTKLPGAISNSACAGPEGASPMDGTSKPSSRMERVSRVEPAAVRHAGGERSAQHRFPRGAAGIDKGSAAASLVPFTAPVFKSAPRRLVNGTMPPKPYATPIARMANHPASLSSRCRCRNPGNHLIHSATTISVPTPPIAAAGTAPSHAASIPDSNSPS